MAIVDWVKHALPMKLKDGKRHVFPTLASMVYLKDGTTPITDGNGNWNADKALDAEKLGGKAPEYYTNPRNLLVNSDFRNPVNQQGVTVWPSGQYGIDRWICDLVRFTATVQSAGLHFTPNGEGGFWLRQHIAMGQGISVGNVLTAAVNKNNEVQVFQIEVPASGQTNVSDNAAGSLCQIETSANGSFITFTYFCNIYSHEHVLEWVALYEGSYTAETLPSYVPKGYANELLACEVAENGDAFSGLRQQMADYRTAVNLLDNSDFSNPVNQRGLTSYVGATYTIDRWYVSTDSVGGVVSVDDHGLTLDRNTINGYTFLQYIEKLDTSKVYTFAVKDVVGNVYMIHSVPNERKEETVSFGTIIAKTRADALPAFGITLNNETNITLVWAALYEGEYTAENLPPYVPKGYAAELAECQRYYCLISSTKARPVGIGMTYGTSNCRILIPTPVTMRLTPSVIATPSNCRVTTATGSQHTVSSIVSPVLHSNGVSVSAAADGAQSNYVCVLFMSASETFALSADL